jgi:hypothetical protein
MNPHEEAFVEAFVHPDKRERFLAALANPKKSAVLIANSIIRSQTFFKTNTRRKLSHQSSTPDL